MEVTIFALSRPMVEQWYADGKPFCVPRVTQTKASDMKKDQVPNPGCVRNVSAFLNEETIVIIIDKGVRYYSPGLPVYNS